MKIAIIIERTNISLGGAERSIFELRNQLTASGVEVDILAATGKKVSKHFHILCPNKHRKKLSLKSFEKALKAYLAENHYDIVHSTLPFDFADVYHPRGGCCAEKIARNAISYQSNFLTSYKKLTSRANLSRNAMLRAEKNLCKKNNGPTVLAVSQYIKDQFERHYGLAGDRIEVIPNGVKTTVPPDMKQADKLRSQILAKLHLKEADDPILLLFVANHFRLKGLSCMIKAMAILKQKKTKRPVYLIVAGDGRPHKYRYLAARLGVAKKLIFLGKLRHVQNALAITDVAALPTFYDPSSRFILEALTAGRPVITTQFNGAVDLFTNNRHGKILSQPEDIPELADAIAYFADRANIEIAALAIHDDNLKQKVSIKRHVAQLIEAYKTIIERKGL